MVGSSRSALIAAAVFVLLAAAPPAEAVKIDPSLMAMMAEKDRGTMIPVLMVYEDPVTMDEDLILDLQKLTPDKRRKSILDAIKKKALKEMTAALSILDDPDRKDQIGDVYPLYLANAIAFDGTVEGIQVMAGLKDAATLFHDRTYNMISATERGAAPVVKASAAAVDTVWSVKYVNADRVWNELGYTGDGVLIGHIDTGVYLTHPDLANRLWVNPGEIPGNGVDDEGNGYIDDVHGWDFGVGDNDPNDDSPTAGHGTHTAGTLVGDGTNGMQTGVAPGATLMAAKVWQADGSGGTLGMIWNAMQYCAENGADVLSVSLGITGDIPEAYLRNERYNCNSLRDVGVTVFYAAGNEHVLYDPPIECSLTARVPSPWSATGAPYSGTSAVVAVGGTGYVSDGLYAYSSQGPVAWGDVGPWYDYPYSPGDGLIKPEVSAPGTYVNSTIIPDGYSGDSWSGTSMACPHVAGLAALMLEKNPSLSPAGLDSLMQQNAVDLGLPGKDNEYGSGRIDAYAIVQAVPLTQLPSLVYTDVIPDVEGDAVLDPGGTSTMAFELLNNSPTVGAVNVSGSLVVVANPYVTVIDGGADFPDLSAGGCTVDNTGDLFVLDVDPAAPQGYEFTMLLTVQADGGYQRTFDIPWFVGLPEWRTHDAGSLYATVTDQGILGYLTQSSNDGHGLGWQDGLSNLFVGSFWAGTGVEYVCNRDYIQNETYEWITSDDPNGRVRDLGNVGSDQTFRAIYSDAGHAAPKPLTVEQTSLAYADAPDDDFVILEYRLTNHGPTALDPLYTGVFCDLDVGDDSGANLGGVDPSRNLTYLYADGGPYYGIAALGAGAAQNLTVISNPVYIYPTSSIPDDTKVDLLSGQISVSTTPALDDWSVLTSRAVTIGADGDQATVAYALVYGEDLADLQTNVDAANRIYRPYAETDDETDDETPPPARFRLAQNTPNPFNPETTIRYRVDRTGHVELAVYDLTGRRLRTLIDGIRGEGAHQALWDGTDAAGRRVPSGIYLYRLAADGRTVTRKMTLVK